MKIKLPREISFLLFIIDRVFKLISLNSGFPVINHGVAFGLFPGLSLVLTVIGLILLSTVSSLRPACRRGRGGNRRGNLVEIASPSIRRVAMTPGGICLIFFGGLSNLLDRIFYKGVVDYIRLGYIFPDFNLADVLIIAGCLMVGLDILKSKVKNQKSKVQFKSH